MPKATQQAKAADGLQTDQLTELLKMQVAYAHFTLEEWKYIALRARSARHKASATPCK